MLKRLSRLQVSLFQHPLLRRSLFIQTEPTPNENSLIFRPGKTVIPSGSSSIEFTSVKEAVRKSRLAAEIFAIEGVSSVYFGPDFISVNKRPESLWIHIKPAVFSAIMDQFTMHANEPIINEAPAETNERDSSDTLKIKEGDSETVQSIKEILSERIRPVVQGDGGDIEYKGFSQDGIVKLKLQGACRSCASSRLTLKNGIENMLKFYVAEVKGVEQVEDEAEQVAKEAFEKFEATHNKPSDQWSINI